MRKRLPLGIILATALGASALGGCAGLQQFPDTSDGLDADVIKTLDADYSAALADIYKASSDDAADRVRRNQFIENRLAVVDVHFQAFVRELARDNANADLLVALAGVGAGGAGALVSGGTSQILSAVSGGLAGGKSAYDKAVLYDNALSALIAQMLATRQQVAARIYSRWSASIGDYPLWLARQDIAAYEFAGSLPGAIVATAEDAKIKSEAAEEILRIDLPLIRKSAVTPEMFELRDQLLAKIDILEADKAKSLVPIIAAALPEAKPVLDLYSDEIRDDDPDGSRAKKVLKRAVMIVGTIEDAQVWQSEIAGL